MLIADVVKTALLVSGVVVLIGSLTFLFGCGITKPQAGSSSLSSSSADSSTQSKTASYRKISPVEAKSLMETMDAIILDVRTESEYAQGHIEGAILLPVTRITQDASSVIPDTDAKILVYCRSGSRSASAAHELIRMGYTDVLDFGGVIDWPYDLVE